MIKLEFIDLQKNLIDVVLQKHLQNKTIIIFPSNNSLNIAMESLQPLWSFEDINLITMEDLYKLIALTERPCLQEVKRLLMFYKSLSPVLKEKYHIADYFASTSFANQFFGLFQELREESIELSSIKKKLESQGFLADWQTECWQDMLFMRADYESFLKETDFDDVIFAGLNFEAVKSYCQGYERIVFANQFYFSESEKALIRFLGDQKEVVLCFQMLDSSKPQHIPSKHCQLSAITTDSKIHLYSAPNDFAMLNKAVEVLDKKCIQTIVDYDFYKHSWFRFLSNEKFSTPQSYSFQNSEIFQYFQSLLNIFDSMRYVEEKKRFLMPLQDVFSFAFQNLEFAGIESVAAKCRKERKILNLFISLTNKGFLYFDPCDLSLILRETECSVLKTEIERFAELIKKLLNISQMNQLIDLIDVEDGIEIKKICAANSLEYTDLMETFYERISNLYSIEELRIVKDWKEIFPFVPEQPIIKFLLKFFVEFVKPTMVSFQPKSEGKISFRTLLETRNLKYDKLVFLNATEGILPKAKSIDFLFNEKQREIIGLKTYDDIRSREKYYFLRLVLSAKESHIFYIENEDDNVEKSSFVEELEIYMPEKITRHQCADRGYAAFWRSDTVTAKGTASQLIRSSKKSDFHSLPADFEHDFKEPFIIKLNTYTITELLKDPMLWFINSNLRFKDIQYPEKDRLDNRILGIIVHAFIEKIYRGIRTHDLTTSNSNDRHTAAKEVSLGQFKAALNDQNLYHTYQNLVYEQYLYKFPHDFSGKYFEQVLLQMIKENIKIFFKSGFIANMSDDCSVKMEISIPETLFLGTENYKVYLSGKPDMVITELKKKFIIDFKTGKEDINQLYLYQWLMSMNSSAEDVFEYDMKFFSVFNTTHTRIIEGAENSVKAYQKKLKDTLDICLENGYFCSKSKSDR